MFTSALHSFLSFARSLHGHSSVAQGHLNTIDPALGLPGTRPPLTSAINALLAIRYSYPFFPHAKPSQCSRSAILANSQTLSIPALLRTSSFLTPSNRDTPTKPLNHFISWTFTFFLSALLIPYASCCVKLVCPSEIILPMMNMFS